MNDTPQHPQLRGEFLLLDYRLTAESPKTIIVAPTAVDDWLEFRSCYVDQRLDKPAYESFVLTDTPDEDVPPLISCGARLASVNKKFPSISISLRSDDMFDMERLAGLIRRPVYISATVME